MAKKGIIITLIFIFSTFIQLLTQIVITRIFGASFDLDAYLAAVAIPTVLVTVIYSTFNDAFLPLFGEMKVKKPDEAEEYFTAHTIILFFITTILVIILSLASSTLSEWMYGARGTEFVSQVSAYMRYLFWAVPFATVATLFGTYYYANKQFLRFPIAQSVGAMSTLLTTMLLAPMIGIWALVISFVMNLIIQIFCVMPKVSLNTFKNINITPFLIAAIPLIIGSIALKSDTLLIRSIGSLLPTGYLVHLNLITKIFSISTGVITIGIQVLLLPHLVEQLAEKNYDKAIKTVNKAKIISVGVSALTAIAVGLIGPLAIQYLFVGGRFTQSDAQEAISLLPLFILPAIGWGVSNIFFQPLIALKKQMQLGALNVIALALAWLIGMYTSRLFNPTTGIVIGLSILLFTGIIGSELLWQYHKKKLLESAS